MYDGNILQDEAGDCQQPSFDVNQTDKCKFQPLQTPRKIQKTDWDDAGTYAVLGSQTSFKNLPQSDLGLLQLVQRWKVSKTNQAFCMAPEKPGLYSCEILEIPDGNFVKLA